jgi:hypothetical protein
VWDHPAKYSRVFEKKTAEENVLKGDKTGVIRGELHNLKFHNIVRSQYVIKSAEAKV